MSAAATCPVATRLARLPPCVHLPSPSCHGEPGRCSCLGRYGRIRRRRGTGCTPILGAQFRRWGVVFLTPHRAPPLDGAEPIGHPVRVRATFPSRTAHAVPVAVGVAARLHRSSCSPTPSPTTPRRFCGRLPSADRRRRLLAFRARPELVAARRLVLFGAIATAWIGVTVGLITAFEDVGGSGGSARQCRRPGPRARDVGIGDLAARPSIPTGLPAPPLTRDRPHRGHPGGRRPARSAHRPPDGASDVGVRLGCRVHDQPGTSPRSPARCTCRSCHSSALPLRIYVDAALAVSPSSRRRVGGSAIGHFRRGATGDAMARLRRRDPSCRATASRTAGARRALGVDRPAPPGRRPARPARFARASVSSDPTSSTSTAPIRRSIVYASLWTAIALAYVGWRGRARPGRARAKGCSWPSPPPSERACCSSPRRRTSLGGPRVGLWRVGHR